MFKYLKYIFVFFILFSILTFIKNRLSKTYVSKSNIQGEGLFANTDFKINDVILKEVFPYNLNKEKLLNGLSLDKFNKYISYEGTKINHCSTKDNSKLVSSDNIHFQLVATRSISKNEEITTDYNITNNKFPFIHAASDLYENC